MNNALNQIAIVKQAINELSHCVAAGPDWFTYGESGQLRHARAWTNKAMAAIVELEKLVTETEIDYRCLAS
jgi:hypothetical protein